MKAWLGFILVIFIASALLFPVPVLASAYVKNSTLICVPDPETALKVADAICRAVFPEIDFELYYLSLTYDLEKDEWQAWYSLEASKETPIAGGGGPEIHIKRVNAEVTFIGTQL